ncbi:hypothetical protein J7L05_09880 [bacterium]|nr:hypothetical protein [bacterium]
MKRDIIKGIVVFLLFGLLFQLGCSKDSSKEKVIMVQPDVSEQQKNTQRTSSLDEQNPPSIEDLLPYPWYVHCIFRAFTDIGISSYYAFNKHVPTTFEDYISSGIPLLIPNDYVSGQTYHLVDTIDINDTSGFTFTSDGIDTCAFEFVINNNKTNSNQIHTKKFNSNYFLDYKDGIFTRTHYSFDKVKREYCLQFFNNYGYIYLDKHNGEAPDNLVEMLKDEGEPIEAGWKWAPEPGSNEYFEYGIDTSKLRSYHIQVSKRTPPGEAAIVVQQMHEGVRINYERVKGVDDWSFGSRDSVEPDIVELNMFISSDNFYDGYVKLKKEI